MKGHEARVAKISPDGLRAVESIQRKREGGPEEQHGAGRVEAEGPLHEKTSSLRKRRKYTAVAASSMTNMITARAAPIPACR